MLCNVGIVFQTHMVLSSDVVIIYYYDIKVKLIGIHI